MAFTLQEEQDQSGSLVLKPPVAAPTGPYVNQQSTKLSLALGDNTPGTDVIEQSMKSGNHERYLRLLADSDMISKMEVKNSILQDIMKTDPSNITPEMIQIVQGLSEEEVQSEDLGNLLEEKYAKVYTNTAISSMENGVVEDAIDENPEVSMDLMDRAETLTYKTNVARTAMDQLQKEYDNQGWLDATIDFGQRMVPFVEWYKKNDAIGIDLGGFLPGSNLMEQYDYLYMASPAEFKEKFEAAFNYLKASNLQIAMTWVEGFMSYGNSDAFLDNALGVADIAGFIPVGKAAKLGSAMKGVVKGATLNPNKLGHIAASIGNYKAATVAGVIQKFTLGSDIKNIRLLEDTVDSLAAPMKVIDHSAHMPAGNVNWLLQEAIKRSEKAREIITHPHLIDTMTPTEVAKVFDDIYDEFIRENQAVKSHVLDVAKSDVSDIGNVYNMDIVLGKEDKTLFESEAQAKTFAKWLLGSKKTTVGEVIIQQKGESWAVVVRKNALEDRTLKLKLEAGQETPKTILGWFRSPDYLLSKQNVEARGVGVQTSETLAHYYDELSTPIRDLPETEFKEVNELWELNRQDQKYYESLSEFETAFRATFGKNPTPKQANAYFASVSINDLDLVIRDLNWYKQKVALGLEDIDVVINGEKMSFEGKVVENLPNYNQGEGVFYDYVVIEKGVPSKVKSGKFAKLDKIEDLKKRGFKIVQVAGNDFKVDGDRVRFVITDKYKRSRLGVKNVDRKPGGHKVHDFPMYIKQGRILKFKDGSRSYGGDLTLWGIHNEAEGRQILPVLEQARKLLLANDPTAWQFVRNNLPINPQKLKLAIKRGDVDLETPFALVKSGVSTFDTGVYSAGALKDLRKNPLDLMSDVKLKFGGERDLKDIEVIRSEANGIMRVEKPTYLSPLDTLRSATKNVVGTRVMNDYSILSARNFWREFGQYLDVSPNRANTDMVAILANPPIKSGVDPIIAAQIKNFSRSFKELLGYPTESSLLLEAYKEKIVNSVIPKLGPRGQMWVEDKLLPYVKDPTVFLRSIAFQTKMGCFNPKQLVTQALGSVNVVAIAGQNGLKGVVSVPLVRAASFADDPAKLAVLAKTAESSGIMKADEFIEAVSLFKESGFNTVGKDVAYLDDLTSPELRRGSVRQGIKTVLDWGTTPFKEGERVTRISAWMAAYMEKKAALKGAKLTNRDAAGILQRAKDMAVNMTRDSNASWQKGNWSVLTQFFGYQARLTELMIGKKLSPVEKMRLLTANSMLYGAPVGATMMMPFVDFRELARQYVIDSGMDPDDTIMEPFIDGFASTALQWVTGTDFNVSSSAGPSGITTIWDLITGDKEIGEAFLGASGSIATQIVMDSWPAIRAIRSEFLDFDGGIYNLTAQDALLPFRNITTVDSVAKLYQVYNLGVWASKNGVDIMELDLPDAVIAVLTGFRPQDADDAFAIGKANSDFTADKKAAMKDVKRYYKMALDMPDGPERTRILKQAKAMGYIQYGLTPDEMSQIYRDVWYTGTVNESTRKRWDDIQIRKEMYGGD